MSEAAQARSHALERQLQLRAPQPQPPPPPQAQLAQLACVYAAEGRASGRASGSSTSNAASPPLFLSAGGSDTHALQHGAGCDAASWSEQESSPPAGCILPLWRGLETRGEAQACHASRS